jgi:hypothetical protein
MKNAKICPLKNAKSPNTQGGVSIWKRMQYAYQEAIFVLGNTFNYSTVVFGLMDLAQGRNVSRMIDKLQCIEWKQTTKNEGSDFLSRLARNAPAGRGTIKLFANAFSGIPIYCDDVVWNTAFRPDGSQDASFFQQLPQLDENALDPLHSHLHWKHVTQLKEVINAIDALGRRNDLIVGFIIPPVYESERTSVVDLVFDRAIRELPNINFVDHRKERANPKYFAQYDHPSPEYFRFLTAYLIARQLAEP